jgi:hypothetical protein
MLTFCSIQMGVMHPVRQLSQLELERSYWNASEIGVETPTTHVCAKFSMFEQNQHDVKGKENLHPFCLKEGLS